MVYAFKIWPKDWEETIVSVEEQEEIFSDIFRKKEIYQNDLKGKEVDKYSFFTMLKEKAEYVLRDKCKFDVRKEVTEEHEFFCVMASTEVLKKEADKMDYKLRFTEEVDKGGYSEKTPAYAPYDTEYHS